MAGPDFLIIGAMKCATSTLQVQLAAQPGVFMTTPKEPNFFSDDEIYQRGASWYHDLFADAAPGDLLGEASTHYTKLPTYPQALTRMTAMLKAPKLIYMIRNPVERAISHYIHEWSEGRMGHDPTYAFKHHQELVDYGCYAMQITPYIQAYGINQIYLTSLERLSASRGAELAKIGAFLNLAQPAIWHPDLGAQNVSADRIRPLPLHGLLVENPIARILRRTLVPKAFRHRIRQARSIGTRPELPDDLRIRLQNIFAADHAMLSRLFPDHPALSDSYPFLRS